MVDPGTSLRHDLLKVSPGHSVAQLEEDGVQNDVARKVGNVEFDRHSILSLKLTVLKPIPFLRKTALLSTVAFETGTRGSRAIALYGIN